MRDTKKLVVAALFTALTCATTMAIKIPTPTMGYIHPGDGMVLLCGVLLGPGLGALAAGLGSMLADLFAGYVSYAFGTLLIKAAVAALAGLLYRKLWGGSGMRVALGGAAGECVMVGGYFAYEVGLYAVMGSGLAAAATSAAAGVVMNVVQGASGVLIALVLLPVLRKVPTLREWTAKTA